MFFAQFLKQPDGPADTQGSSVVKYDTESFGDDADSSLSGEEYEGEGSVDFADSSMYFEEAGEGSFGVFQEENAADFADDMMIEAGEG